jgi:hypothetical protein
VKWGKIPHLKKQTAEEENVSDTYSNGVSKYDNRSNFKIYIGNAMGGSCALQPASKDWDLKTLKRLFYHYFSHTCNLITSNSFILHFC